MIGRLWGPYSEHEGRFFPYEGTPAADRLLVDFAVEVVAQATKTVERARYGIEYVVEGDDRYRFEIAPAPQQYGIMLGPQRRNFMASDRSSAVNRAGEENHLRMEVQGDTIRVYVNGQLVDQAQHEGLARRGGTIELVVGMYGPPGDNEVEVRFADFRLYALDPQVL